MIEFASPAEYFMRPQEEAKFANIVLVRGKVLVKKISGFKRGYALFEGMGGIRGFWECGMFGLGTLRFDFVGGWG